MPRAQVLDEPGTPLRAAQLESPPLRAHQLRIAVAACGVCRTDLHVRDGELLLCAGLIGYRALRFAGDAGRLGLYGFGASAHIVAQIARAQGRRVFALTRPGDADAQALARSLGVDWAGGTDEPLPDELDAAIVFAPAGELVPAALARLAPGGRVVCAGIHMTDIPSFPYELLWRERSIASVANLTRADGEELFALLRSVHVETTVETYPLERAEEALDRLRGGGVRGAAVLLTR